MYFYLEGNIKSHLPLPFFPLKQFNRKMKKYISRALGIQIRIENDQSWWPAFFLGN